MLVPSPCLLKKTDLLVETFRPVKYTLLVLNKSLTTIYTYILCSPSTAGFGPYTVNFQCPSGASALVDCSINTGSSESIFLASVECYTSGEYCLPLIICLISILS